MSGKMLVGRIYKRAHASNSKRQWLWGINGVHAPDVMVVAGTAASFEEAQAELQQNWEKWLAWANLREISSVEPPHT